MKYLYFGFLIFVLTGSASAQVSDSLNRSPVENAPSSDTGKIRICAPSRVGVVANRPLYVINNIVLNGAKAFEFIRHTSVEVINVVKDSLGTDKYGPAAKNGLIEITLKKDIKLLDIKQLLKEYRIKKRYWGLPIFIELKRLVSYDDFYITNDIIKDVKVIQSEDKLSNREKFIKVWLKPL